MATVELRRDPFGRQTLMREFWTARGTCPWCGQEKRLWLYWWEPDGIAHRESFRRLQTTLRHKFCSIRCWEAWNDF